jgi:hypothetical protein
VIPKVWCWLKGAWLAMIGHTEAPQKRQRARYSDATWAYLDDAEREDFENTNPDHKFYMEEFRDTWPTTPGALRRDPDRRS